MHVITGGAGFIGSALMWQLNNLGIDNIIVVDSLDCGEKWRNLVKRRFVDYIHKDKFRQMAVRDKLPFTLDSLTHLGACSSTTEANADFLMENNFHYSQIMCQCALRHNARFINASSAATYGSGENGFSDDPVLTPRLRPLNMYGYSKQLFDLWLLRENLAGNVASLKFFNVYGPNEYHKGPMASVAYKLFNEISATGRASLFASEKPGIANGGQKRDFVYVKDCVELLAWLMLDGRSICGIRNVGTGHAATFMAVAEAVFAALDKTPQIDWIPMPRAIAGNYQYFTEADMSWLKEYAYPGAMLGIEHGIADYARNYLATCDKYL